MAGAIGRIKSISALFKQPRLFESPFAYASALSFPCSMSSPDSQGATPGWFTVNPQSPKKPTNVILTNAKVRISVAGLPPKDGNVREVHMKVPRFDIFCGTDKNAQWIEVVEGLDTASRRMEFYAAKCPGKYFVFNCLEHSIADSIDTSSPPGPTIQHERGWQGNSPA